MIEVGDYTIWPLNDGYLDIDQREVFVKEDPAALRQQLTGTKCVGDLIVRMQVHGYLVDTGEDLILIDTGSGDCGGATVGFLVDKLHSTGHDPSQVSLVLLTHLHWDHIGGLLAADGTPAFPNATICVPAIGAAYWRDPAQEALATDIIRPYFAIARKMLAPYESKGKLRLIQPGEIIVPGVTAIDASGHSPDHTAFLFTSDHKQVLFWGDIVHTAGIQFAKPEWFFAPDMDIQEAIMRKKSFFAKAADEFILIGGAHLPLSGLGYVSRTGDAFAWEPLDDEK